MEDYSPREPGVFRNVPVSAGQTDQEERSSGGNYVGVLVTTVSVKRDGP